MIVATRIVSADPDRCMGCRSCELACALASSQEEVHAAALSRKVLRPRMRVGVFAGRIQPFHCRHCEDAKCVEACPTDALAREGGQVHLSDEKCVGCKLCAKACPHGAITVGPPGSTSATGRVRRMLARKCNLCSDTGLEGPACIPACPTRALQLVVRLSSTGRAESGASRPREEAVSREL